MMTPEERAERLCEKLGIHPLKTEIDIITSQIKQACEEPVREAYTKGFHEGQEGLFQKGFSAARERAAKEADSHKVCEEGKCWYDIAEGIRALKPEGE